MRHGVAVPLCGLLSFVAAGVCAAGPWYIRTVDGAKWAGEHSSLALDANGFPHISYYGYFALKHAAWNGTGWDIQKVDTDIVGVGQYTSIRLGGNGYPRISYYDHTNYDLKYAAWNGSSWDIETVESAGHVGRYTSLGLGPIGWVYISYYDSTNFDLKHAFWNGTTWVINTVDNFGEVGSYSSLEVDSSNFAHISYHRADFMDLKYARWNGSTWVVQTVDSGNSIGRYTSLALDANNRPRISYYDWGQEDLKYAAWTGSTWIIQTVDSMGPVGEYSSITLDANGYPHISYYGDYDLKYAAWNGSGWDIETVDNASYVGQYTSLALDDNGSAHISYYDSRNRYLKYATTRRPGEASHPLPSSGYYMISLPLNPSSPTVHDVFCDELPCSTYYLYRWQDGRYSWVPTWSPDCEYATLDTQHGYWLGATSVRLDIDVGGALPSYDQAIPLRTGWNMIPAPHEATMDSLQVDNTGDVRSLQDAQSAGWVLATFYYSHDGTKSYSTLTINQTPADRLSLWHGYWVLAAFDCSLIVPEPSTGGSTMRGAAQHTGPHPAWAFDIRATSPRATDSVTLAAADGATDDFDGFALDKPKPPPAPGESNLRLAVTTVGQGCPSPPAPAIGLSLPAASELAMETKSTDDESAEWQCTLTGGVRGETVTVSWPDLGRLPKHRVAVLTDRDSGKRTFMRTRAHYECAAPGAGGSRRFVVTVKPARTSEVLVSGFSVVPLRSGAGAEITFGLSGEATVDVGIVNVAGRLVHRLRQGVAAEVGTHTVVWSGRSTTGAALPSGTYMCVLRATTPDGRRATAVRPITISR